MNDSRDLKAIAEACQQHQPLRFMRSHGALYIRNDNGIVFDVHQNRSFPEFMAQNKDYADLVLAANPAAVLALIAENECLRADLREVKDAKLGLSWAIGEIMGECDRFKVENEALRKDADRAAYWKQRAKSAEGHLFSGDFRAAAMELHKYSRFESTPWPELTGSQHALITSAAGAVIATVNRLRDARRPKNRDETDAIIWCACGDGYAANSYGAGFMDANGGVCANCDAAVGCGRSNSRGSEQDQIPTETPVPERSACRSENP